MEDVLALVVALGEVTCCSINDSLGTGVGGRVAVQAGLTEAQRTSLVQSDVRTSATLACITIAFAVGAARGPKPAGHGLGGTHVV